MRTYGQHCPIARGAEIFAERWTPIIMRNILLGCTTFTQIQRGAPGIPRSLLGRRLSMLERHGIIERRPLDHGRGAHYLPTEAGKGLWTSASLWASGGPAGSRFAPEHLDPYVALWSMGNSLAVERLPDRRVVVRFDFPSRTRKTSRFWLLLEHGKARSAPALPAKRTWW